MTQNTLTYKDNRWLTIALHIFAWSLFMTLPYIIMPKHGPPHVAGKMPRDETFNNLALLSSFITNLLLIPVFYLNLYVLFPRLVPAKRVITFFFIQLALLLVFYFIKAQALELIFPHRDTSWRPFDIFGVFIFTFVSLVSFSYGQALDNIKKERIQKEKENEALKSELQFLRWQISPHFLFNVLNNTVALARIKSDKLESTLIKISTMMRYMLYEADTEKVSLSNEIEYIRSYIDLQSLRLGDDTHLNVTFDIPSDSAYSIEPMLLIPFVENAFKHGVGNSGVAISITARLNGTILEFEVTNNVVSKANQNSSEVSGIGLVNIRRRLELLYNDRYTLTTKSSKLNGLDIFQVSLKLILT